MHIFRKTPNNTTIFFLLIVFFFLISASAEAVSLRVGETYTCTLSHVPTQLRGVQWTSSRPYDVVIQTSLTSYTTSIVIKAEKAFSGAPCVIHCEYYYLELDPTTGRYIYSRTGYQDWNIFVKDNEGGGNSGGDVGSGNSPISITIEPVSETVSVGSWVDVYATVSPSNAQYDLTWSISDKTILQMSYLGKTCMTFCGLSAGNSSVTATTNNGLSASCSITVKGNGSGSQDGGGTSSGNSSSGDNNEADPFSDVMIELEDVELVIGYIYKMLPKTFSVETDAEIVWTSSNDKIVRVDQNGYLRALSEGTAIIKASLPEYNDKAGGAKVIVKQAKKREDVESVKTKLIEVSGHILKTTGNH